MNPYMYNNNRMRGPYYPRSNQQNSNFNSIVNGDSRLCSGLGFNALQYANMNRMPTNPHTALASINQRIRSRQVLEQIAQRVSSDNMLEGINQRIKSENVLDALNKKIMKSKMEDVKKSHQLQSSEIKSPVIKSNQLQSSEIKSVNKSNQLQSSELKSPVIKSNQLQSSELKSPVKKSNQLPSSERKSPEKKSNQLQSIEMNSNPKMKNKLKKIPGKDITGGKFSRVVVIGNTCLDNLVKSWPSNADVKPYFICKKFMPLMDINDYLTHSYLINSDMILLLVIVCPQAIMPCDNFKSPKCLSSHPNIKFPKPAMSQSTEFLKKLKDQLVSIKRKFENTGQISVIFSYLPQIDVVGSIKDIFESTTQEYKDCCCQWIPSTSNQTTHIIYENINNEYDLFRISFNQMLFSEKLNILATNEFFEYIPLPFNYHNGDWIIDLSKESEAFGGAVTLNAKLKKLVLDVDVNHDSNNLLAQNLKKNADFQHRQAFGKYLDFKVTVIGESWLNEVLEQWSIDNFVKPLFYYKDGIKFEDLMEFVRLNINDNESTLLIVGCPSVEFIDYINFPGCTGHKELEYAVPKGKILMDSTQFVRCICNKIDSFHLEIKNSKPNCKVAFMTCDPIRFELYYEFLIKKHQNSTGHSIKELMNTYEFKKSEKNLQKCLEEINAHLKQLSLKDGLEAFDIYSQMSLVSKFGLHFLKYYPFIKRKNSIDTVSVNLKNYIENVNVSIKKKLLTWGSLAVSENFVESSSSAERCSKNRNTDALQAKNKTIDSKKKQNDLSDDVIMITKLVTKKNENSVTSKFKNGNNASGSKNISRPSNKDGHGSSTANCQTQNKNIGPSNSALSKGIILDNGRLTKNDNLKNAGMQSNKKELIDCSKKIQSNKASPVKSTTGISNVGISTPNQVLKDQGRKNVNTKSPIKTIGLGKSVLEKGGCVDKTIYIKGQFSKDNLSDLIKELSGTVEQNNSPVKPGVVSEVKMNDNSVCKNRNLKTISLSKSPNKNLSVQAKLPIVNQCTKLSPLKTDSDKDSASKQALQIKENRGDVSDQNKNENSNPTRSELSFKYGMKNTRSPKDQNCQNTEINTSIRAGKSIPAKSGLTKDNIVNKAKCPDDQVNNTKNNSVKKICNVNKQNQTKESNSVKSVASKEVLNKYSSTVEKISKNVVGYSNKCTGKKYNKISLVTPRILSQNITYDNASYNNRSYHNLKEVPTNKLTDAKAVNQSEISSSAKSPLNNDNSSNTTKSSNENKNQNIKIDSASNFSVNYKNKNQYNKICPIQPRESNKDNMHDRNTIKSRNYSNLKYIKGNPTHKLEDKMQNNNINSNLVEVKLPENHSLDENKQSIENQSNVNAKNTAIKSPEKSNQSLFKKTDPVKGGILKGSKMTNTTCSKNTNYQNFKGVASLKLQNEANQSHPPQTNSFESNSHNQGNFSDYRYTSTKFVQDKITKLKINPTKTAPIYTPKPLFTERKVCKESTTYESRLYENELSKKNFREYRPSAHDSSYVNYPNRNIDTKDPVKDNTHSKMLLGDHRTAKSCQYNPEYDEPGSDYHRNENLRSSPPKPFPPPPKPYSSRPFSPPPHPNPYSSSRPFSPPPHPNSPPVWPVSPPRSGHGHRRQISRSRSTDRKRFRSGSGSPCDRYGRRKRSRERSSSSDRSYSAERRSKTSRNRSRSPSPAGREGNSKTKEEAISNLWTIHNRECNLYRRNPSSHPDYSRYQRMWNDAIENEQHNADETELDCKWQDFWNTKIERIFRDSWREKKKHCLSLLNPEARRSRSVSVYTISSDSDCNKSRSTPNSEVSFSCSHASRSRSLSSCNSVDESVKCKKMSQEFGNSPRSDFKEKSSSTEIADPCPSSVKELENRLQAYMLKSNLFFSPEKTEKHARASQASLNDLSCKMQEQILDATSVLAQIVDKLGNLGVSVTLLHRKVSEALNVGQNPLELIDEDAKMLLDLVGDKIRDILDTGNLSIVQMAIVKEAYDRLTPLLQSLENKYSKERQYGLDINFIAKSTLGKPVPDIIAFIRDILTYNGVENVYNENFMDIYLLVKNAQKNLTSTKETPSIMDILDSGRADNEFSHPTPSQSFSNDLKSGSNTNSETVSKLLAVAFSNSRRRHSGASSSVTHEI